MIVKHEIIEKNEANRYLDKYLIYKEEEPKSIEWLFIGLNPSANNDEFTDETNLWIINALIKKNGIPTGYYLTNLNSHITSDSNEDGTPNVNLIDLCNKFGNSNVCVFYGRNYKKIDGDFKKFLIKKIDEEKLFYTCDGSGFHHISKADGKLRIQKCNDIESILPPK